MRNVRLLVSSPGDVAPERQRVQWLAERLNGEFAQTVHFDAILWETAVYNAHDGGFQPQIEKRFSPGECDIVIAIFWSRLGTELPDSFPERMPDGRPYPSGTAYEVLSALEARKRSQCRPDVFVLRKNEIPTVPINDRAAREEADRQWEKLEQFFSRHFELADKRILRAVEKFHDLGELERKVNWLLRDWIKSNVSQGTIWSIAEKGSPFRGLEAFDARHADVYCGRDRKVQRALDELLSAARRGKPFLLIPGASGAGKSSLMRAGITPRLVRPGTVADVDLWRIAVMRPGADGHPMLALAQALFVTGDEKSDDPGGFGKAIPELAEGAFRTPDRLARVLMASTDVGVDPIVAALDRVGQVETQNRGFERPLRASLLLLVDQFEDIFARNVSGPEGAAFAELLAALINTQRVWVIATLRGDMYERMITERPFVALKDICGQYDLGPPGQAELDEIIHRSAEAAGLQYEERVTRDEKGNEHCQRLDDRLLRDASGENTLPLLQFALDLLFEKCWTEHHSTVLTLTAYEEIGGLDGAINRTAELALARLVRPGEPAQFPLGQQVSEEIARSIQPRLERLLRKLVAPVGQSHQAAKSIVECALTARVVPSADARRDTETSALIDTLLGARILLASQSAFGSSLRLAHDRVMTSWHRARKLIEKNRAFYRIKEAIETEHQRWEESHRSTAYLLPAGAQVTQAERAVQDFSDEFSQGAREFVSASGRRARLRQRLMTAATLIFAAVAIVATAASYYASQQRRMANQDYEAARDTVGKLVTGIAQKLRDQEGITDSAIEAALQQVGGLVTALQARSADDPELNRIEASMHFEFAKVFQNARLLDRALEEAESSLNGRQQLAAAPAAPPDWRWDETLSLDQVGDIQRAIADSDRDGKLPPAKAATQARADASTKTDVNAFAAAQKSYEQSYNERTELHQADGSNPLWMYGLSQSLVRLGDLALDWHHDLPAATADYRQALKVISAVVEEDANNIQWQRELSWDLMKVGDALRRSKDPQDALAIYEDQLGVRRYVLSQQPENSLYERDLAVSLERIGAAKMDLHDFQGASEALFEALRLREDLSHADRLRKLWLIELAQTEEEIGQCMMDSQDYSVAGGFYQLAIRNLQRASGAAGAATELATANAGYANAISKVHLAAGTNPPDADTLGQQAIDKDVAMQKNLAQRPPVDVTAGWAGVMKSLKSLADAGPDPSRSEAGQP